MDPITLFLVDDNELARRAIRLLLEGDRSFNVVGEAANAGELLASVANIAPRIVLMDLAMPVMNGIEATRQLCVRENHPDVVMVSMQDNAKLVAESFLAGACGYVLKNHVARELPEAIRAVAGGSIFVSSGLHICGDDGTMQHHPVIASALFNRLTPEEQEVVRRLCEPPQPRLVTEFSTTPEMLKTLHRRIRARLSLGDTDELLAFARSAVLRN